MKVDLPLRLGRGMNGREHHFTRARRVRAERHAVGIVLACERHNRPQLPCTVTLTRIAPSEGLDGDNLQGSLKAVRDAVAGWFGIDDKSPLIEWEYAQRKGPWAVEIEAL